MNANRRGLRICLFCWTLCLSLIAVVSARAEVVLTGDVSPQRPDLWRSTTDGKVGNTFDGSVTVDGGSLLLSGSAQLGISPGVTGEVIVDGAGSFWDLGRGLTVGVRGNGTLEIANGGRVEAGTLRVREFAGSSGTVRFDTGTLSADKLIAAAGDLLGAGTINTKGLVTDVDLVFDEAGDLVQTIVLDDELGQNIAIHLDLSSASTLGIGHSHHGLMRILNGVTVASVDSYVGFDSGSDAEVLVDGVGSTWRSSADLSIGHSGSGKLSIVHGGTVDVSTSTWIGKNTGSLGELHLDGGTLKTRDLMTSPAGTSGTGTIFTKGLVSDIELAFNATLGSSRTLVWNNEPNQSVTVQMMLDSSATLGAGYAAQGVMTIREGRSVQSGAGHVGHLAGSSGEITVDGNGSAWVMTKDLTIGNGGHGLMNVNGGGMVSNGNAFASRLHSGTSEIYVDGAGSLWDIRGHMYLGDEGDAELTVSDGGQVQVRYDVHMSDHTNATSRLTVDGEGSELRTSWLLAGSRGHGIASVRRGGSVVTSQGSIAYYLGSSGEVSIDGAGSDWTSTILYVGDGGDGKLMATNGATIHAMEGHVGERAGSAGEAIIDGLGTLWKIDREFEVGSYGDGKLTITNGASVLATDGVIGNKNGATGVVTVEGTGSLLKGVHTVGVEGDGTLQVSGGAGVEGVDSIGGAATSVGRVAIDGIGSTMVASFYGLYVGRYGDGYLTVTDGGQLTSRLAVVGWATGSWGEVRIDGVGSSWTTNSLGVARGLMHLTRGGQLTSTGTGGSIGNEGDMRVNGEGSTWTTTAIHVAGTLAIERGGVVTGRDAYIAPTGQVTIDGAGASWTNRAAGTYQGKIDNVGKMMITGGGSASNRDANLISTGQVVVDGAGSTWINQGVLRLRDSASLTIRNGGNVSSSIGRVGTYGSYSKVLVEGEGSSWISSSNLFVGDVGRGELKIADGAYAESRTLYVGNEANSLGVVSVSGVGSTWSARSTTYVGYYGSGTLRITDGGTVHGSSALLGYYPGAVSEVLVDGLGSSWRNGLSLTVGRDANASLNITSGGLVTVGNILRIGTGLGVDSSVNLSIGGMLALYGEAENSLNQFLDLVQGNDNIRYWSADLADWAPITNATYGRDYTLEYQTTGDLTGYTLLTVGTNPATVPEPPAWLLLVGAVALLSRYVDRRPRGA